MRALPPVPCSSAPSFRPLCLLLQPPPTLSPMLTLSTLFTNSLPQQILLSLLAQQMENHANQQKILFQLISSMDAASHTSTSRHTDLPHHNHQAQNRSEAVTVHSADNNNPHCSSCKSAYSTGSHHPTKFKWYFKHIWTFSCSHNCPQQFFTPPGREVFGLEMSQSSDFNKELLSILQQQEKEAFHPSKRLNNTFVANNPQAQ